MKKKEKGGGREEGRNKNKVREGKKKGMDGGKAGRVLDAFP